MADVKEHHGISHIASVKVLLGTWMALMALTVITVLATKIQVGPGLSLFIAMAIATFKASLVCVFFMHLRYDKLLHTVALVTSLVFALLFVAFTLMDSNQYQEDVVWGDVSASEP